MAVQSWEGEDPRSKLAGAAEVTLTEAEVRKLRRDMQEQENLIQGYQVALLRCPALPCPALPCPALPCVARPRA